MSIFSWFRRRKVEGPYSFGVAGENAGNTPNLPSLYEQHAHNVGDTVYGEDNAGSPEGSSNLLPDSDSDSALLHYWSGDGKDILVNSPPRRKRGRPRKKTADLTFLELCPDNSPQLTKERKPAKKTNRSSKGATPSAPKKRGRPRKGTGTKKSS